MATKWGKENIRCNAVAPGVIAHARMREITPQAVLDAQLEEIRLPRLGNQRTLRRRLRFLSRTMGNGSADRFGLSMANIPCESKHLIARTVIPASWSIAF